MKYIKKINENHSKQDIKDIFIFFEDKYGQVNVKGFNKGAYFIEIKLNDYFLDFNKIAKFSSDIINEYYECVDRLIDMGYNIQKHIFKTSHTELSGKNKFSLESTIQIRINKKVNDTE
jgi:hypothetical protein